MKILTAFGFFNAKAPKQPSHLIVLVGLLVMSR